MNSALKKKVKNYESELDVMRHILMKPIMTDQDLIQLKRFLYKDIPKPKSSTAKDLLRERLVMLAYLLDL